MVTENIYFETLSCGFDPTHINEEFRVKVNDTYVGAKNAAQEDESSLTFYISVSNGYAKKGDVISCKTSTFVAYGLKK